MGGLISRLRAKPSTKELLEELEKEIESLEEYKRSTEQQHKRVVGSLIFYFILLFIVGAAVFILYYFPVLTTTNEKLLYSIPLWLVPVLFYLLKKFLHWYFTQKIKYNEENLSEMKKKKRLLLEYAMETETYKIVKELLIKYDPNYHKKIFELTPAIEAPPPVNIKGSFSDMEVRKRSLLQKAPSVPVVQPGQTISLNNAPVRHPMQPMPRPVPPRERTLMDRFVDYLVGDGPSNRYALICRQCQSHNGMALREEFEFVAFRCCYCFHWNPPRNQQPPPPRLPLPSSESPTITEPQEVSSSSGIFTVAEETDGESIHEEGKSSFVKDSASSKASRSPPGTPVGRSPPGTPGSRSPPGSPPVRRRLQSTASDRDISEISAILEEDRTNACDDIDELSQKE